MHSLAIPIGVMKPVKLNIKSIFTGIIALWMNCACFAAVDVRQANLIQQPKPVQVGVILVLGDSLSASYGFDYKAGWVNLLQQELTSRYSKFPTQYRVVNASISGETAGGGLARLPALLKQLSPKIVILELGGNDGLRGHPLNVLQDQLEQMIRLAQKSNADVVLLGMKIPPNYGKRYTEQFEQIYARLAEQFRLAFVPFFLLGVASNPELMQDDGIHPTKESQSIMLQNVLPTLLPLLKSDPD